MTRSKSKRTWTYSFVMPKASELLWRAQIVAYLLQVTRHRLRSWQHIEHGKMSLHTTLWWDLHTLTPVSKHVATCIRMRLEPWTSRYKCTHTCMLKILSGPKYLQFGASIVFYSALILIHPAVLAAGKGRYLPLWHIHCVNKSQPI